MTWVKSDVAAEVAVVAAWLAALVPWSVTVHTEGPLASTIYAIRFPLAELQVRHVPTVLANGEPVDVEALVASVYPGTNLVGNAFLADPISAALTYGHWSLQAGSAAWAAGAAVLLVALGLSVATYRDETGTERRLPRDPVRVMGGLLGLATLCFALATGLYWVGRDVVGVPVPVGVLVTGALAVALVRAERV